MSLANGRPYVAIPGPSVMPDRVIQAMMRPAPNIYEGDIQDVTERIVPKLKQVARTDDHVAIYICNGHGTWEACLTNCCSRGDRVLVLVTGRFGRIWGEVATRLGLEAMVMDFGKSDPANIDQVRSSLQKDPSIKAVLVCQTDTATSIRNDVEALGQVMKDLNHDALLMVDAMASMGCDRLDMDAWGVDVVIAGSQKGLMTPPGLGFVWFSKKAMAAYHKADLITPYWDWGPRANPNLFYEYFYGTAPTHHLYGLDVALDMLLEEGMDQVWIRHKRLSEIIWDKAETWGPIHEVRLNVADRAYRSHSVTALSMPSPKADQLRHMAEHEYGVTLGIGLGMAEPGTPEAGGYFRIGHMGHVNAHMVMGVLAVIEDILPRLD